MAVAAMKRSVRKKAGFEIDKVRESSMNNSSIASFC